MALRLIEITVSEETGLDRASIEALLDGHPIVDAWQIAGQGERRHLRLLLDAADTEEVLDRLNDNYSSDAGFRAVLLAVEGTLPRLPEPEARPEPDQARRRAARRVSREELYAELGEASEPSILFVVQVVLSTAVAAVGLRSDNVAVLIGAMVIAPLLGPNVALAFGATLGDLAFMRRALRANLLGLAVALVLSVSIGFVFRADPTIPAIASRTVAHVSDIVLALASGVAGTLAFTSGAGTSIIGVMVAVALLPPLAAAGMLLGAGEPVHAGGAFLLLVTNVICVNLAAVATFATLGVRPSAWWERKGARTTSRLALLGWTLLLAAVLVFLLRQAG